MSAITQSAFTQTVSGKLLDLSHLRPDDIDLNDIGHGLSMQPRWYGQTKRWYSVADHSIYVARLVDAYVGEHSEALDKLVARLLLERSRNRCMGAFGYYEPGIDDLFNNDDMSRILQRALQEHRSKSPGEPTPDIVMFCQRAARALVCLEAITHDAAETYIGDMASPIKHQIEVYCHTEKAIDVVIREAFGLEFVREWTVSSLVHAADLAALRVEARELCARPDVLEANGYAPNKVADAMVDLNLPLELSAPGESKSVFIGRVSALLREREECAQRLTRWDTLQRAC